MEKRFFVKKYHIDLNKFIYVDGDSQTSPVKILELKVEFYVSTRFVTVGYLIYFFLFPRDMTMTPSAYFHFNKISQHYIYFC